MNDSWSCERFERSQNVFGINQHFIQWNTIFKGWSFNSFHRIIILVNFENPLNVYLPIFVTVAESSTQSNCCRKKGLLYPSVVRRIGLRLKKAFLWIFGNFFENVNIFKAGLSHKTYYIVTSSSYTIILS